MHLGIEIRRLGPAGQSEGAVEVVHHRQVKRSFAGIDLQRAGGSIAHAVDVVNRPALFGLGLQLKELAVEQQDVADHQVGRIVPDQRGERRSFVEVLGNRFFEQDDLARFEQGPGQWYMRGGSAGDNPGLRVRLGDGLVDIQPPGHARQIVGDLIETHLPPRQ